MSNKIQCKILKKTTSIKKSTPGALMNMMHLVVIFSDMQPHGHMQSVFVFLLNGMQPS